ncbi:ubiquitin carboxyl-terminal hydrolase 35 [Phasianus colchicus]|uniref:ubiquitin carboxyl-terminal hydrolase 35 n=1 Tax=Phasianus colchicus TaxID=9054 RepID=UPI00129E0490|nr:ubiquitin carboxyl-terminal hydrolase 35 [Phasianus colchicus]
MDKILEAVVMSSYPNNVKQGLVRRVIEASKQPMDSEQCWSMLELCTKLYLVGDTKYKREIGKEVLEVYGHYHPEEFEEFFNVRFLLSLLQEGYGPLGKRSHYVLDYIQLGLQFVLESPSANSIFSLLRIEVLRKVCERPSPKQCAKISKLLTQHPQCIPTGKHQVLFCQQLIRCIGQFQCVSEGEDDIMEFLEQVNKVSGLLQRIWRTQTSAILPSLKELFTIISSTEEQEVPSNALASVVQFVPLELMDGVIRNLTNDDSITDVQMMMAIGRMIDWVSWPLGKNIDKWIIALLKGLAAVKKFSILIEVTLSKIEKVFSKLLYPIVREGALSVLQYMLLSFQHSHEAFHLLLPHIPRLVTSLKKEDSNSATSSLEQLAELIHCMFFRFSGYPDLYEPVLEAIKRPAISPESFLSASWPPWFTPGAQQDCSEYLKYLLDRYVASTPILELRHVTDKIKDKRKAADVTYLDFCKAFDTVLRDIMVTKLEKNGSEGRTARWIRSWLDGPTQRVAVSCSKSMWRPVMSGVPQELVLGPSLFNIFVDNVGSGAECTLSKFADNTKPSGVADTLEERDALQRELDRLERWVHANLVELSKAKCKVLYLAIVSALLILFHS